MACCSCSPSSSTSTPTTTTTSPKRAFFINKKHFSSFLTRRPATRSVFVASITDRGGASSSSSSYNYNPLVFQAARLLGPPARFEASKLKVVFMGDEIDKYTGVIPRSYSLSHCDLTANLTLAISNAINIDQLKGWYNNDDVVAEWKNVRDELRLHVHCHVSGPYVLPDIVAEFRYHIFNKELPLVLKAVLHGDLNFFKQRPELVEAMVWVFFHSTSKKYNHVECWGPLRDAAQRIHGDQMHSLFDSRKGGRHRLDKWGGSKSIFQALVAFLL